MFWGIEAPIYADVFYWTIWALCLALGLFYLQSPNNKNLLTPKSPFFTIALVIIVTIFLGYRPSRWFYFGDSSMYAHHYNNVAGLASSFTIDFKDEWFFNGLESICKFIGLDVRAFFLIVAAFYIVLMFVACQMLLWENTWMAMLFCMSSFSFYQFAINGIRTGMATSIMLVAMALLTKRNKLENLLALFFFLLAFGTHRSMMLPIGICFISYFFIKNPLHAIYIWLGCIGLSLVAGSTFQNMITSVISTEDGRMAAYSTNTHNVQFAHTGFRWDFLLYSSVPVILTYYMVAKKGIQDKTFNFLATTYILTNSFWVLVIRMAFTNRFAFLSWFMYPLVLAYALIRVHIWDDQDKKAAYFLLGSTAFSCIMFLLGKI